MPNTPVRQYIGARYVPTFANPTEWDKTRTYEPLTIVQHAGNSYTSRQYVPQNIEITNTDFWALTGNYNAQVEAYRQTTQKVLDKANTNETNINNIQANLTALNANTVSDATNLKNKIDNTENKTNANETSINNIITKENTNYKHILAIGDSITHGTGTTDPEQESWIKQLTQLTQTTQLTNLAQNNAGFTTPGHDTVPRTFPQQLEYAKSQNLNPDCIIIAGGINDAWSGDPNTIEQQVHQTIQYAITNWPNATIYYIPAPIARTLGFNAAKQKNLQILNNLINGALGLRVKTLKYAWEWLCTYENISNDGIHPNAQGAQILAKSAYQAMQGTTVRANLKAQLIQTVGDEMFINNNLWVAVNNGFCQISGEIGVNKTLPAFSKIFQLPQGFEYHGILSGILSNAQQVNNIYYPSNNADRDVNTMQSLPSQTTIYVNTSWQIGVN